MRAEVRSRLAWTGAVLAVGVLAFGAGVSGLLGNRIAQADFAGAVVAPVVGVPLLDCPAGRPVTSTTGNNILYVVARSPDSAWLAVRSVVEGYRTVWLEAERLTVQEFPEGRFPFVIGDLPVQACERPEVAVVPAGSP